MEIVSIIFFILLLVIFSRERTAQFTYKKRDGAWRAYFRGNPPSHIHVLHDGDGYYVCWDRPPRTQKEARQTASLWNEKYG